MRHYWLNITCLNNLDILNNVTAKVNTVNKCCSVALLQDPD